MSKAGVKCYAGIFQRSLIKFVSKQGNHHTPHTTDTHSNLSPYTMEFFSSMTVPQLCWVQNNLHIMSARNREKERQNRADECLENGMNGMEV